MGGIQGGTLGGTEYPGKLTTSKNKVNDVSRELRAIEKELHDIRELDDDVKVQFPDVSCGEMLTRWDMIQAPPDILITNLSMLNTMLLREIEEPIIDQTKEWLQENKENKFSLVIDELHSYRGTAGTEVAIVLRNLINRLGLELSSPQLRVLGTSASLDGETGKDFLEDFFGIDKSTFKIIP